MPEIERLGEPAGRDGRGRFLKKAAQKFLLCEYPRITEQETGCVLRLARAVLPATGGAAMTAFRCVPIATEIADRFRRTGLDDNGNAIKSVEASGAAGRFPCRHCLRCAASGQTMLLGSYNLPWPRGIYWTPSPIFLHAEACARFASENEVAPIVRLNALVSVRAYDAADQCLYELGHVCSGADVDAPLERALGDARTAFVNIHTARPGCLLSRVERIDG
ncbi:MAG TPA: DUF1203 domain-containing protein [Acidocella sp.]|uniref:DUF1203 domain-containing protein n=1 Tax=Acidocella sp. TaxID=50710 RepID=UPI002C9BD091|nr:DUF1203 domain-containing protein [Acidocella sp.]HVE20888.1 DUF1203 domain-containing protein [Acidocella sp.]